jgi:hypothetical protein
MGRVGRAPPSPAIVNNRLEQESLTIDEFYTRHREEARKSEHMTLSHSSKNRSRK